MPAFEEIFSVKKPIMAMLHLKGEGRADVLRRAKAEADLLTELGADALIVEDYFGNEEDVEAVLAWLYAERPHYLYGVNLLDQFTRSCALAKAYGARFVQVDSAAGHLAPKEDLLYEKECFTCHSPAGPAIFGGVRFKYKPVLSGRPLEEDLRLGRARCDAIVVTGEGTGMDTGLEKITEFRKILGPFPLIIGAGLTPENVKTQLSVGDGAIVGSCLKEGGKAENELSEANIRRFMAEVRALRAPL